MHCRNTFSHWPSSCTYGLHRPQVQTRERGEEARVVIRGGGWGGPPCVRVFTCQGGPCSPKRGECPPCSSRPLTPFTCHSTLPFLCHGGIIYVDHVTFFFASDDILCVFFCVLKCLQCALIICPHAKFGSFFSSGQEVVSSQGSIVTLDKTDFIEVN